MKQTVEQKAFQLLKDEQYKDFIALIQKRTLVARKPVCNLTAREDGVSLLQAAAHKGAQCADAVWQMLSAQKDKGELSRYVVKVCHDALKQSDIPALRYFLNSGILRAADKEIGRDCVAWPDAFCVVTTICDSEKLTPLLPDVYRSEIPESKRRVAIAVAETSDVNVAKEYLSYGDMSLLSVYRVLGTTDEVALFFLNNGLDISDQNYLSSVNSYVVADKLIEMGQNVHELDADGRNVLRHTYDPQMFRYYVEKYGADVNQPDKNGDTILDWNWRYVVGGDFLPQTIDLFVKAGSICKNGVTAQEISDRMARSAQRAKEKQNQPSVETKYRLICAHDDKERRAQERELERAVG